MKRLKLLTFLVVVTALVTSCDPSSKSGEAAKHVPQDASAVIGLNLKKLMQKADFQAVKKMEFYQDMLKKVETEQGEQMATILKDPEKSGVDMGKNAYFFTHFLGEDRGMMSGLVFSIADGGKFEAMVEEMDEAVKKAGDFKYADNQGDGVVAWNGSVGFVGSLQTDDEAALEAGLKQFFAAKSGGILSNKKAAKSLNSDHDITFYMNSTALATMMDNVVSMAGAFIKPSDLKNNVLHGFTDFENGKVVSKGVHDLQSGLVSDLKLIFADGCETDFSRYVPAKDLGMLMVGKLNFKGINQLLKDKNLNGMVNMQLNQAGLSSDDLAKAIEGDLMICVNGKTSKGEVSNLMALKIGDQAKFEAVMQAFEKMGIIRKTAKNQYDLRFFAFGSPEVKMSVQDGIVFLSNDDNHLERIEKGGFSKSESVEKAIYKQFDNDLFGVYMNSANIANYMQDLQNADETNVSTFQSHINWKESEAVLEMKDKKQNSLKALIESLNKAYLDSQKEVSPSEDSEI